MIIIVLFPHLLFLFLQGDFETVHPDHIYSNGMSFMKKRDETFFIIAYFIWLKGETLKVPNLLGSVSDIVLQLSFGLIY